MHRFVGIFLFVIFACQINAQSIYEENIKIVETLNEMDKNETYVYISHNICHSSLSCPAIKSKWLTGAYVKKNKKSIFCNICYDNENPVDETVLLEMSKKQVENKVNLTENNYFTIAGKELQTSAKLDYISIGLCVAGITSAGINANYNNKNYNTTSTGYYIAGAFGIAAFVTELVAINYKLKAGSSLKIGANHITYNF